MDELQFIKYMNELLSQSVRAMAQADYLRILPSVRDSPQISGNRAARAALGRGTKWIEFSR